ncbi:hypothetical protein LCGC14_0399830 [marine sediment metagenome]|uniref:HNH nuclease domain-containing protein n=1 Tax=marine sediment metagenome TaxID=412755 RepID=A0A0F9TFC8_9ZZZZ
MKRTFLARCVSTALTQREIARLVGCSQTTVRYWLRKHGLKTIRRPRKVYHCLACDKVLDRDTKRWNKFCNTACFQEHCYRTYIAGWLRGKERGGGADGSVSDYVRRYLFEQAEGKCVKCGWAEINPVTQKKPLGVNHKDGNSRNHRLSNLELLCPNCHSLTPTFGSLNNGRGRHHRRKAALLKRVAG